METTELSAERLRQIVKYDPSTGIFVWLIGQHIGKRVGSIHSGGYIETRIGGLRVFLHRAAWFYMTGRWPLKQIDHVNGVRHDNRWDNLREAEQKQNSANMAMRRSNKSGRKGVVHVPQPDVYRAYIHVNGRTRYLGTFMTGEAAHDAYCYAAKREWGVFARTT